MKSLFFLGLSSIITLPQVLAQYQWKSLSLSTQTPVDYLFVRPHLGGTTPVKDVTSLDLRCNVNGSKSSAAATLTIHSSTASSVQQIVWTPNTPLSTSGAWTVYLAQVPANSTASSFDGSGQVWFKIDQGAHNIPTLLPTTDPNITLPIPYLKVSIPKGLLTADYLVRVEFIDLTNAAAIGGAQFFVSCGQISIVDGGSKTPKPLVAIPGVYRATDPGIHYSIAARYTFRGPPVWPPLEVLPGRK
ncbi:hypothetical protein FRC03_002337 [Tulasnella sp. 419]|nr:hypothetical protein FRC03_002337 [Tulasnella sp. 419]